MIRCLRLRQILYGALVLAVVQITAAVAVSAQIQDWPTERPPRPLPARDVNFPPYQVRTLANGLQVIAVSHHEQPAVSVRLIVRAGGAQDPADKPGVAYVAAALLDQGTTSRNAEQIANAIDSIGGAIGAGAGTDLTFINAAVMKDSLGVGLDLVADLARHPAFAPEEIDRQRQQISSGLKVSYDDPGYLAGVVFDRLVYGFHPYGRPDSGTPASIAAMTREDLLAYHQRWFGANNAILAIVGDVTAEEAFAGAERAFGGWARVEAAPVKAVEPPPPTRRVIIIDKPGAVQTEIRVGGISLPRRHADYLALDIASKILGGEGGNRLHRVLRSERGLTYGASADLNALKDTGDLVAETNTRTATTAEALRIIVDEIFRLQKQRVQTRELADAQEYLTGSFPLTIETPGAIALQVLNAVFYGVDLDELQTYRQRVSALTVDDIQRVAQQYLHPDRLAIVLVGDASVFAKQLAGVGFDQVERIPIADLDLTAPDLRRRSTPAFRPPKDEDRKDETASGPSDNGDGGRQAPPVASDDLRSLIARAVSAKGGADLLRSIRTAKATGTMTVHDDRGQVQITTTTSIRYPGAFRVDAQTPRGPLVQVFTSGDAWVQDERGPRSAPRQVADDMRFNVQRDAVPMLLGLSDGRLSARKLPDVTIDGRSMTALEVQAPGMAPVTVLLDPATALIVRIGYSVTGAPGGPASTTEMEETYSDYRDIGGLKVAHKAVVLRAGKPFIERVVRRFEFNVPLDPALFTKPG